MNNLEKVQAVIVGASYFNAAMFGLFALEANNSVVEDRTLAKAYAAQGDMSSAETHTYLAEDSENDRNMWGVTSAGFLLGGSLGSVALIRRHQNHVNQ